MWRDFKRMLISLSIFAHCTVPACSTGSWEFSQKLRFGNRKLLNPITSTFDRIRIPVTARERSSPVGLRNDPSWVSSLQVHAEPNPHCVKVGFSNQSTAPTMGHVKANLLLKY